MYRFAENAHFCDNFGMRHDFIFKKLHHNEFSPNLGRKLSIMKFYLTVVFAWICWSFGLIGYVNASVPDSATYQEILHIAAQVTKRYIPDKRTAIFELVAADSSTGTYRVVTTVPAAQAYFNQLLSELRILPAKVTINLLPDASVADRTVGVVNLSVANLRVQPSNQAELASQVLLGTVIDLLQHKDGYYRIRTPEGYIAWMSTSSATPMSAAESVHWKTAERVIFSADFGHSYTAPDERSLRVSDLVMGNILCVKGKSDGFVHVSYPDGRLAYVRSDLVRPFDKWLDTLRPTAAHIIATAKTMMGIPYLWGGTSVKGVDCSGFTKTAFYMNGIVIPRDASQQVLAGQPVDILSNDTLDREKALKQLQPADLLFFATGNNRPPDARVTHVALYLGNGEFIHSAGTVRINSMLPGATNYEDFQTRTLVAARRYIGQTDQTLQPISSHQSYREQQTEKQHP